MLRLLTAEVAFKIGFHFGSYDHIGTFNPLKIATKAGESGLDVELWNHVHGVRSGVQTREREIIAVGR